ncbi:hypothetical protein HPT25_10420 [Bacillus sp. BRMEA1]|uniref:hypothetical protein n=1 Tax=Neobacillus endophyticus TaxID=2738405 RepID=UPI001565CD96|nr:hypothetical protein [Neobacillus endophyticus]NRD77822.1 hypothetical protein [Neobacillus endophyticus]
MITIKTQSGSASLPFYQIAEKGIFLGNFYLSEFKLAIFMKGWSLLTGLNNWPKGLQGLRAYQPLGHVSYLLRIYCTDTKVWF